MDVPSDDMPPERYEELTKDLSLQLSNEEVEAGWHFCLDWDGMLIHVSWPESKVCTCCE